MHIYIYISHNLNDLKCVLSKRAHAVSALDVRGLDLLLEQFELANARDCDLVLVSDQAAVKVDGKGKEDYENWYEDDAGRPGGYLGKVVELDPAKDGNLDEKE